MDGHTMDPTGTMAMTATGTMDMASATTAASSHSMSMGYTPGQCRIRMLWNWYTIDACFLAETWHIRTKAMFAGSCIGVILLVISLEFLRRSVKEYDRYIIRQHVAKVLAGGATGNGEGSVSSKDGAALPACAPMTPFRPSVLQQAVRAGLHMCQFAVAYFIMLLAMYYNGYIIICIFIGAYIGSFIFHWEKLVDGNNQTSASREATVCCG